ncbi:NADPH-dependent oxidoreductase [Psychrobacillus sp.]|uniref:NADPH-dependent oxidoreductase n=1 Tax=Psychrobacillus sp. TaxID=1871623 RepID=UPI0028BD3426|nr:NADPH-dependent oxidoreductase [Psychrobacillus sp.]
MNKVLETIMNHKSVRKFKDIKLTNEQINVIIKAAQMAPSSLFMQDYAIIGVTDQKIKEQLYQLTKGRWVKENGLLLIFCSDLNRITILANDEQKKKLKLAHKFGPFKEISTINTSIAAQNASLTAESMGFGVVYSGAIAEHKKAVKKILKLPRNVVPLFGLCIGVSDSTPEQKPRLPLHAVYFQNEYIQDEGVQKEILIQYDETMKNYYASRTDNKKVTTWSEKSFEPINHLPTSKIGFIIFALKRFLLTK